MRVDQAMRVVPFAFALLTLLATLGACSTREPMLPLCEGAAYAGQANALAAEAIDAAATGDAATLAIKLEAARGSLEQADRRLAEAVSAKETEGWQDTFDAFGAALDETRSVLDALAGSPPPPTSLLREQLESAGRTLTTIGPPAGCVEFGAEPSG